jgi:hypothetical protein
MKKLLTVLFLVALLEGCAKFHKTLIYDSGNEDHPSTGSFIVEVWGPTGFARGDNILWRRSCLITDSDSVKADIQNQADSIISNLYKNDK